jgi:hypothetical protein
VSKVGLEYDMGQRRKRLVESFLNEGFVLALLFLK